MTFMTLNGPTHWKLE